MDPSVGILAIVIGFVLRFGIPIGITAGLVVLLRKLDARWQREGQNVAQESSKARELFPLLRCWVLNDCPEDRKASCRAYLEAQRPCWQVFREKNGRLQEPCLDCDVLRRAPVPVKA